MSDVSALIDKLKTSVSYKQFDAPRSSDRAWPVLEKMAQAKNSLTPFETPRAAGPIVTVEIDEAPSAPAAATTLTAEPQAAGSLFDRLQAEGRSRGPQVQPANSARFSRYGATKAVNDAPEALSEIFERIGRKAS